MASIFTQLAFMHGHITDVALARRLAGLPEDGAVQAPKAKPAEPAKADTAAGTTGTPPAAKRPGGLRRAGAPGHWMILGLR